MNEPHIAPGPVPSVRDGADIRDKSCTVQRKYGRCSHCRNPMIGCMGWFGGCVGGDGLMLGPMRWRCGKPDHPYAELHEVVNEISMALAVNCICALLGDMNRERENEIELELRKGSIITVGTFSYSWNGATKS